MKNGIPIIDHKPIRNETEIKIVFIICNEYTDYISEVKLKMSGIF